MITAGLAKLAPPPPPPPTADPHQPYGNSNPSMSYNYPPYPQSSAPQSNQQSGFNQVAYQGGYQSFTQPQGQFAPPAPSQPTQQFVPQAPAYGQAQTPAYGQTQTPAYGQAPAQVHGQAQGQYNQAQASQAQPSTSAVFQFDTMHEDLIHDAQLDYYGRRLATASSDRTVRVWEVPVEQGSKQPQRLVATLSGHEGPVWQVAWAHPRFGSVLASCSYDGSVIIWKEATPSSQPQAQAQSQGYYGAPVPSAPSTSSPSLSWIKVKEHRLHEASVNAVAWAAPELGLVLACASSDGRISVLAYQVESGSWSVSSWMAHQVGVNAVSWHPHSLRLASGGCDNAVRLWSPSTTGASGEWREESHSPLEPGHGDWVRDVAWAPQLGNEPAMLASCGQDKAVLIWQQSTATGEWTSQPLRPDPFAEVCWTVDWSLAGSLLAVTCGDSRVSVWRQREAGGGWEQVQELP